MGKKVVLVVADSLGVGQMPDAGQYGDHGCNTFGHIWESCGGLHIPNLLSLGWGNIEGVLDGKLSTDNPIGCFGKMSEASKGKDTTTGHWELAGLKTEIPFKTYPDGFPKEFIEAFEKEIGVGCLGNYPASGTEIIETLGPEHEATGKPIVYTSADSVFQIAANTEIIPLERLYEICQVARRMLIGQWACARVIARPYRWNEEGKRERTSERRDYSVNPPAKTILDFVKNGDQMTYAIGKISDIFNGQGITQSIHNKDDMDGVDHTIEAMKEVTDGLIFTNLVDFDAKYGHRRDPLGYGKNIELFDQRIPELLAALGPEDLLMIVADHGNDPTAPGTDHTREYVPLLVFGKGCKQGVSLGTRSTFADVAATIADWLNIQTSVKSFGKSFQEEITSC